MMRWSEMSGNARGVLLMLLNALVFSIMVLLIKALSPEVPLFVIMFFSVAMQLVFISGRAFRRFGSLLVAGERRGAHLGRAALLMASMLAGFYSVTVLPLAISTSLSFSKAMFVTLFAAAILPEVVGARRWLAVLVGFVGVLILSAPDGSAESSLTGIAAGVVSAAAAGLGAIMTRHLAQKDSVDILLLHQTLVGVAVLAPLAAWTWRTPDPVTLALLLLTGGLSVLGNTSMIKALRWGEASVLAPVDFSRAIFAGILGYLVFDELPGWSGVVGMLVIVLGTVMSFRSSHPR